MSCEHCKDWGKDCLNPAFYIVYCPECKRPTYPNLGVNLPAEAAVSIGASTMASILQLRETFAMQPFDGWPKHPLPWEWRE